MRASMPKILWDKIFIMGDGTQVMAIEIYLFGLYLKGSGIL